MQTLYKITDHNNLTRNNTLWGSNVTNRATGKGQILCTDGVIHAYTSPELAVIFHLIYDGYFPYKLWKAEGEVLISDGTKVGCKSLTTIKEIPIPEISLTSKVAFGILCFLEVHKEPKYVKWANNWLDGTDRSKEAAYAAADAVYAVYAVYATDAAYAAADAVYAVYAGNAAYAARAAAYAAARAVVRAAAVSGGVAYAAANAAKYTNKIKKLDLQALIEKAMTIS